MYVCVCVCRCVTHGVYVQFMSVCVLFVRYERKLVYGCVCDVCLCSTCVLYVYSMFVMYVCTCMCGMCGTDVVRVVHMVDGCVHVWCVCGMWSVCALHVCSEIKHDMMAVESARQCWPWV